MSRNRKKQISDQDIGEFSTFKQCHILSDGQGVSFIMGSGARYDVPLTYLLQWSPHPHSVNVDGELKDWEDVEQRPEFATNVFIVKCRRVLSKTAVNIYLSNNTTYLVPWDTLLMACESRYEHFGGWTPASKKIVTEWFQKVREQHSTTRLYARKLRLYHPHCSRWDMKIRVKRRQWMQRIKGKTFLLYRQR